MIPDVLSAPLPLPAQTPLQLPSHILPTLRLAVAFATVAASSSDTARGAPAVVVIPTAVTADSSAISLLLLPIIPLAVRMPDHLPADAADRSSTRGLQVTIARPVPRIPAHCGAEDLRAVLFEEAAGFLLAGWLFVEVAVAASAGDRAAWGVVAIGVALDGAGVALARGGVVVRLYGAAVAIV